MYHINDPCYLIRTGELGGGVEYENLRNVHVLLHLVDIFVLHLRGNCYMRLRGRCNAHMINGAKCNIIDLDSLSTLEMSYDPENETKCKLVPLIRLQV